MQLAVYIKWECWEVSNVKAFLQRFDRLLALLRWKCNESDTYKKLWLRCMFSIQTNLLLNCKGTPGQYSDLVLGGCSNWACACLRWFHVVFSAVSSLRLNEHVIEWVDQPSWWPRCACQPTDSWDLSIHSSILSTQTPPFHWRSGEGLYSGSAPMAYSISAFHVF